MLKVNTYLISFICAPLITSCMNTVRDECNGPVAFIIADENEDCRVTKDEWLQMVKRSVAKLPPSTARDQFERSQLDLFHNLDKNGDMNLDSNEWLKGNFSTVQDVPAN